MIPLHNPIAALEAVLFVSGDAVSIEKLCEVFAVTPLQMSNWLDQLEQTLQGRGIELIRTREEVQLAAVKKYNPYIERLAEQARPVRLSAPTLETLAIIAYRQPITRPEIEEIRGVKVEKALTPTFLHLITEVGRRRDGPFYTAPPTNSCGISASDLSELRCRRNKHSSGFGAVLVCCGMDTRQREILGLW